VTRFESFPILRYCSFYRRFGTTYRSYC